MRVGSPKNKREKSASGLLKFDNSNRVFNKIKRKPSLVALTKDTLDLGNRNSLKNVHTNEKRQNILNKLHAEFVKQLQYLWFLFFTVSENRKKSVNLQSQTVFDYCNNGVALSLSLDFLGSAAGKLDQRKANKFVWRKIYQEMDRERGGERWTEKEGERDGQRKRGREMQRCLEPTKTIQTRGKLGQVLV